MFQLQLILLCIYLQWRSHNRATLNFVYRRVSQKISQGNWTQFLAGRQWRQLQPVIHCKQCSVHTTLNDVLNDTVITLVITSVISPDSAYSLLLLFRLTSYKHRDNIHSISNPQTFQVQLLTNVFPYYFLVVVSNIAYLWQAL